MLPAFEGKVVIVHGLAEARLAMAVAQEFGKPIVLASAPGAAGYAGAPWFRELLQLAKGEYPDTQMVGLLDCGDKPGFVLGALDKNIPFLRFTGSRKLSVRLAAVCMSAGVRLITRDLRALDLGSVEDPHAACRNWLGSL